jgi:glycosyltransferase involved in cell wall biosynthesis
MHNILFVYDYDVNPLASGIDRVIASLSAGFAVQGQRCFLAYFHDVNGEVPTGLFEKKLKISKDNVQACCRKFIAENKIDIIFVHSLRGSSYRFLLPVLCEIAREQIKCKLIFLYHNHPGYERYFPDVRIYWRRLLHGQELAMSLKNLAVQYATKFLSKAIVRHYFNHKYRSIWQYADKIVLLSPSQIPLFAACAGILPDNRLTAIGNILSFPDYMDAEGIRQKKREVLIVARLEERQKRVSLALKIWELIEKSERCEDWQLIIVGTGPEAEYYRQLSVKKQLKRVSFEGRQAPEAFYSRASVFMMTSAYEGFPMTLGEAMQMGVVPLAFDSFSAVHDIIEDGQNGFLFSDNDLHNYADKMLWLMQNEKERQRIAVRTVERSKRFDASYIIREWLTLFDDAGTNSYDNGFVANNPLHNTEKLN